jgi:hypothetical protein
MKTIILPNNAEWKDELGMNNSAEAMEWVNENLLNLVEYLLLMYYLE